MTALAGRAACLPTWVLTGPPIISAVLLGTAVHHRRTKRFTR